VTVVAVPMGEAAAGGPGDVLAIYGLGSCVALAVWDPETRRGVLCHIVLPEGTPAPGDPPARFAGPAVDWAVRTLGRVPPRDLVVKLAGGASVLPTQHVPMLDIGRRNLDAVFRELARRGMRVAAEDTGGKYGRTVFFHPADGGLVVRTAGGKEQVL